MAYVTEEALQKREPLVQGAELNIDGKGGKFLIRELIGAGGTSLVYDAVLVRADGSRVTGVLKEFYPQVTAGTSYNFSMLLRYMTVRRKPNGTLAIPAELRDGQRKRLEEVDSLFRRLGSAPFYPEYGGFYLRKGTLHIHRRKLFWRDAGSIL